MYDETLSEQSLTRVRCIGRSFKLNTFYSRIRSEVITAQYILNSVRSQYMPSIGNLLILDVLDNLVVSELI